MELKEIIKTAFLDGYATSHIQISTMLICMICTSAIAVYIFLLYRNLNKNSFYNRNFNLSLMGMAVITAAIILTVQSNIVVSLGMVGALSIVRFRTAIKDPMDLVFLFWAISAGIICGAGFAMIAVIASLVLTIVLVLFSMLPDAHASLVLVVNADDYHLEEKILQIVKAQCAQMKVRARNVSRENLNLAIEVRGAETTKLLDGLMQIAGVTHASLVEHDGDVTI